MPTWIIEPRDPLIARDGRPFGPTPGARARSLPFPFPSTTTGGLRTRAGLKDGVFDTGKVAEVKKIGVRGPLLVELDDAGEITKDGWLAPAPADALLVNPDDRKTTLQRLLPAKWGDDALTDLPPDLLPVTPKTIVEGKPPKDVPRFWNWETFAKWLLEPKDADGVAPASLGHSGPQIEQRMHVSILPDTQTAVEGALFMTSGLEFTRTERKDRLKNATRLALAVESEGALPERAGVLSPLGGERRLVSWRSSNVSLPACPPEIRKQISEQRACRVVLLTPACFEAGYRPKWLLDENEDAKGVKPSLIAVACDRPQVVSGWDFAANNGKGAPKPTRRLAPAGSVFFLKLDGSAEAIGKWVDALWMQCISDEPQDRLDGFGLAVLGTWNGEPLEVEK
ncbi:MAG: type III-B CRISPR module-associated Cmr3 family protein [Chloroflexia bacterium]